MHNNSSTFATGEHSSSAGVVPEYVRLFLNIGELIGHLLLECPFSALNLHLIWTTSVLHINLKFILMCQSLCIFARGAVRICVQLLVLLNVHLEQMAEKILIASFNFSISLRNHIPHILVIERFMATLFAKNYETWHNPCFTIFWLSVTVLLSAIYAIQSVTKRFPTRALILDNSILLGLCAIETLAFFWLWFCNLKKYRQELVGNQQMLSERYQLAENIRTTKQLAPTLLLHLINLSIITVCQLLYHFDFADAREEFYHYSLITQIQFTLITYTNFLIELTILINHPFLHYKLHWLCQMCVRSCARRSNRVRVDDNKMCNENECSGNQQQCTQLSLRHQQRLSDCQSAIGLTDMSGKTIALSLDQDAYFSQLRKYWN